MEPREYVIRLTVPADRFDEFDPLIKTVLEAGAPVWSALLACGGSASLSVDGVVID